MNQWKGVRKNMSKDPNSPIELYNLNQDIKEQENLAAQYPKVIEDIRQIMNKEHTPSTIFQFKFEEIKSEN
jgi:arylsulfatase